MKKLLIVLSVLLFVCSGLFAGPFGLEMGMTYAEVTSACDGARPELIQDDFYQIFPVKKHSYFDTYYAWIDEEEGLYYLKALTYDFSINKYGSEMKDLFNDIIERISKKYGNPEIYNELIEEVSPSYKKDDEWFYTLQEGQRILEAWWSPSIFEERINSDNNSGESLAELFSKQFYKEEKELADKDVSADISEDASIENTHDENTVSEKKKFPEDISHIVLFAKPNQYLDKGCLVLEYKFKNAEIVDNNEDDNF